MARLKGLSEEETEMLAAKPSESVTIGLLLFAAYVADVFDSIQLRVAMLAVGVEESYSL